MVARLSATDTEDSHCHYWQSRGGLSQRGTIAHPT